MLRKIRLSGLSLLMLLGPVIGQDHAQSAAIAPHKGVQDFLAALSSTDPQVQQSLFPAGTTPESFRSKLAELIDMAGGPQALIVQLLYARTHASTTSEAMMPMIVVEQLSISDDDQVAGLLPYLEVSDNSVLKETQEWLGDIDFDRESRVYKFDRYLETIRKQKSSVPQGLVKYMYTKSPDAALSTMAKAYLKKEDADALVEQSKNADESVAINQLSQREQWWVNLYVAEKIKKNPKLRTPAVLERVNRSSHALVKKAVSDMAKEEQGRGEGKHQRDR